MTTSDIHIIPSTAPVAWIRHPLQNIAEWRKGCSCAPKDFPVQCEQCTEGLILAVERWFTQRNTHRGAVVDNILENLDGRAAEADSPGIAGDAATLIRELDAELYAAQDQITGLQELMACGDKALANAQRRIPGAGKVSVSAEHLRTVLEALKGSPHRIRELQAIAGLPGSAITVLIDEFNRELRAGQ